MVDTRSTDLSLFEARQQWARANARGVVMHGVQWLVYELETGPQERELEMTLVFEADGDVRRVAMYPDDWRSVPDEDLIAIRARA